MDIPLYVVVLRYVVPVETLDTCRSAHLKFLDEHYEKGFFFASGPQSPRYGGVILAKAGSREQLTHVLHKDPFFQNQYAEYQIFEFSPTKYSEEFAPVFKPKGGD
jgi:uncharacterized protein YciI